MTVLVDDPLIAGMTIAHTAAARVQPTTARALSRLPTRKRRRGDVRPDPASVVAASRGAHHGSAVRDVPDRRAGDGLDALVGFGLPPVRGGYRPREGKGLLN